MYSFRDYLSFGWQLINGFQLKLELDLAKLRDSDIQQFLDFKGPLKILDLANGRFRPQYLILDGAGNQVFGIDLANRTFENWSDGAYSLARKIFVRQLNSSIKHINKKSNLVCGDVSYLPFSNSTFDLITSVAAFEHFTQVHLVISEIHRVTRPGGIVWVYIHPFTSLSGGHNVKLMEIPLSTIPNGIDPWDHLRERQLPFHVPLNELRIHQYLDELSRSLEIIKHYCFMHEGEHLLSQDIAEELSNYSREELTYRGYIIVARKS